ncbi:MAG: cell division protein ZapA [Bacteroidota bacterium]
MNDLIPITIMIADRTYRIRVEPADEEPVRKTVKFINDKVLEFKRTIAGKDMQDYVSMALIWIATQPVDSIATSLMSDEVKEGFERLELLVDKGLAALPEDN